MASGRSTNPEVIKRHRSIGLARQRAFKALAEQHPAEFATSHADERVKLGLPESYERRKQRGRTA